MNTIATDASKQKICKACGNSNFNPGGECRPCKAARGARYRALDPEAFKIKNRAYQAKFAAKDPERRREQKRKNAENLRLEKGTPKRIRTRISIEETRARKRAYMAGYQASGQQKEKKRLWRAKNPEAAIINSNNYRARKRQNGGTLTRGIRKKLFKLQKGKCVCCGEPLGDDFHLDHRMPVALGGPNTDDNMQLLRKVCNLQKQAQHPTDFMQSRGFLL